MEVVGDDPAKDDDDSVSSTIGNETTTKLIVVEPIPINDENITNPKSLPKSDNRIENQEAIDEKMPVQTLITDEKESLLSSELKHDDIVEEIELNGDVRHISASTENGVKVKLLSRDMTDPENESLSDDDRDLESFSTTKLVVLEDVEYTEDKDIYINETSETTFTEVDQTSDKNTVLENKENEYDTVIDTNETVELDLSEKTSDDIKVESGSVDNDIEVVTEQNIKILNDTENTEQLNLTYNNNNNNTSRTNGEIFDMPVGYSQQSSIDIPGKTIITEETSFSTELAGREDTTSVDVDYKEEDEEVGGIEVNNGTNVEEEIENEPNENVRLMEGNEDEEENEESEEPVRDGDSESIISVFRGSMNIEMVDIPWITDVDRVIDIQLGAEEWGTEINKAEGELSYADWGIDIYEIEKGEDVLEKERDIWDTTINEMSTDEDLQAVWNSEIIEKIDMKGEETDWSTTFNKIEKIDETKTTWRTIFRKIKEHISSENEWTTTFNEIETLKTEEDEHIATTFSYPEKPETWDTKFIKIDGCVNEDEPWPHTFNDVLLKPDDHEITWETKFIPIEPNTEEMNPWDTTFNKIGEPEKPNIWDTTFYAIASEEGLPQPWDTKFIDIEKHVPDENEWTTVIEDRSDMPGVPEDWDTLFKLIQEHASNPLWDTYFNKILPKDELLDTWEEFFNQTDLEDIERKDWETNFIPIENVGVEEDWTLEMNNIMLGEETELPDDDE